MCRKKTFTMLEILIALGVCAIGVCSIMVLFPIGANANRDAAMETYAAHAADQLLHYLQYQMSLDWETILPDKKPKSPEYSEIKLTGDKEETGDKGDTDDTVFSNIISCGGGVYLVQSVRGIDDDNDEKVDFRAILVVWKDNIVVNDAPVPHTMGVKLNVEVSWPAEIPYAARQKALYCLEVYNPNVATAKE